MELDRSDVGKLVLRGPAVRLREWDVPHRVGRDTVAAARRELLIASGELAWIPCVVGAFLLQSVALLGVSLVAGGAAVGAAAWRVLRDEVPVRTAWSTLGRTLPLVCGDLLTTRTVVLEVGRVNVRLNGRVVRAAWLDADGTIGVMDHPWRYAPHTPLGPEDSADLLRALGAADASRGMPDQVPAALQDVRRTE